MSGSGDEAVEQLSSAPRGRPPVRWIAGGVALALVALVVVAVVRPGFGAAPAQPPPRPTLSAPPAFRTASEGSVFLEHLAGCRMTDHRHRLTVAFGVTNLSAQPLRLLGASPTVFPGGLALIAERIGAGPCAATGRHRSVQLASAQTVVVALSFRVGPKCPRHTLVAARVSFESGSSLVHADTSELADLDRLSFAQC